MDIRKLQRIIVDALVEIKGKDIVVFNTEKLTDQFSRAVFASGTSNRHTVALAENLEEVWGAKRVNMKIDPEYALPVRKTEKA